MKFNFGDYVVYIPKNEIGRVVRENNSGDGWFVCYNSGCTSANTPNDLLRAALENEIEKAPAGIGYHRFDDHCEDYCEGICFCSR